VKVTLNSATVDIVAPGKGKLYPGFSDSAVNIAVVHEHSVDYLGIYDVGQKVLVMRVSVAARHILRIRRVICLDIYARRLAESPQAAHEGRGVFDMVPDGMSYKLRPIDKLADCPSVLPMNPTIGISDHHDVNIGLVNCSKPMDHVCRS
jgi:hypothetical protein